MDKKGGLVYISAFLKAIGVIKASWWVALFPLWLVIIWGFILEILKEKKLK